MQIPRGPQELTPQWLTCALRQTSTIREAAVLSLQASALAADAGVSGQRLRLTPEYDVEESGAPQTLIAKLSASDPAMRNAIHRMGSYGREVWFYQQIAEQIELPTPRCYHANADDAGWSVLLLEDLAPARCGNPVTRDKLSQAELAIRQLARFHAHWWESPHLDAMDRLMRFDGAQVAQMMQPGWDAFFQRAGGRLPDQAAIERICGHVADIYDRIYGQPPRTLMHNDYQSNNLFFATPQGGVPFAVIDWQAMSLGRGAYDVAFYLVRSAPTEDRRAIEMGLLEAYHATLVENGVQAYTLKQCVDDYRLSTLYVLARLGTTIGQSALSPYQKRLYPDTWLPRIWTAISDLNALDLLPG